MEAKTQIRLASLLTALLGLWIAFSPLFMSATGAGLVNVVATGTALALFGLIQVFSHNSLPSWFSALAGMWLFVSAFVFSVSPSMSSNEVIAGVAAIILALWDSTVVEETYHTQHAV
jgi:hypothetical protein